MHRAQQVWCSHHRRAAIAVGASFTRGSQRRDRPMATTRRTATDGAPAASKRTRAKRAQVVVPHLTVAERVARGKAARAEVPRSSHAAFEPSPNAPDPLELLERQAKTRVPELVPIRYGRMLVSPFTFYRGAALIMADDLAATPRSGLTVQCCGDAHLSNFGVFASPERRLVFDVNDFDETLPGPVGVGRQAPGGQHADRGARQRLLAPRSRSGSCSTRWAVPDRDARVRRDEQPRRLVRAPGHRGRARGATVAVQAEAGQARGEDAREGAHAGQHVRLLEADPYGRRPATDRRPVAADRAARRSSRAARARGCSRGCTSCCALTGRRSSSTGACCSSSST